MKQLKYPSNHKTPRPNFRLICSLLLLMCVAFSMTGCDDETSNTLTAKIGGKWFTLEIASNSATREKGLMGRTEIPSDGGMIFIFNDLQKRSFWMKNCLVDMDILYLDRSHRIVSAYNMKMQPPKGDHESEDDYEARIRRDAVYPSHDRSQFVIELKAGKIQELRLKRGEKVILDEDQLKELVRQADDSP